MPASFEEILSVVTNSCRDGLLGVDELATPRAIKLSATDLTAVCWKLLEDPITYFDSLSCITGLDNGPAAGTMEVIYNLYSIPFHHHLMLRVTVPRDKPEVDSVSVIWKSANWLEREVFDMYGVNFNNHPDLRRILMPADWEGYPLRKDYIHQEYYRDIKVKF